MTCCIRTRRGSRSPVSILRSSSVPRTVSLNRFAELLKVLPVLPLACPDFRMAPVYVLDVAEMMARSLSDPDSYGKRFELCGPEVCTLLSLVEYVADLMGVRRWIVPLPDPIARLQGRTFDLLGPALGLIGVEKPFSMDNYLSMRRDSVCHQNDLETYGIVPQSLEALAPVWFVGGTQRDYYNVLRHHSGRD